MTNVGSYSLEPINTGNFALDGGAMFGVVPKILWQQKIAADEQNRIPLSLRTLLIRGEGKVILIDAGIGDKWPVRQSEMFAIDQPEHPLVTALAEKGLAPGDVTDLIVTHCHFDHVGGATVLDGDRKLVPTLPNAKVHVQKSNWEHANHPNEKDRASYLIENFQPLWDAGLISLVDGEREILPGISVLQSNGHTIGQQLVKIGEGADTVLYCGDLIPTSAHLPVPWVMGYDLYPMTTIEEKKKLLPIIAKERWRLYFEHDPVRNSCVIDWTDRGPVITASDVL